MSSFNKVHYHFDICVEPILEDGGHKCVSLTGHVCEYSEPYRCYKFIEMWSSLLSYISPTEIASPLIERLSKFMEKEDVDHLLRSTTCMPVSSLEPCSRGGYRGTLSFTTKRILDWKTLKKEVMEGILKAKEEIKDRIMMDLHPEDKFWNKDSEE